MNSGAYIRLLLLTSFAAIMIGCGDSSGQFIATNNANGNAATAPAQVLVMTNAAGANAIREFRRDVTTGALTFVADYPTGGAGSADALNGSTNAIFFDAANNLVYAVNAGNNTISAMRLNLDGSLTSLSTVASGGTRPISITASSVIG